MSVEEFFNHPLVIWEWITWFVASVTVRELLRKLWKKGKKQGRTEFDEYKKWEARFKDEGKIK